MEDEGDQSEPAGGGPAGLAGLATPGRSLVTRCTAGQFPVLEQHFPADIVTTVTTETAGLTAAARTAALLLDDGRQLAITLDAADDEIVVSAPVGGRGRSRLAVPATVDGPPVSIRFQAGRLLAAISPAGERCRIGLQDRAVKPALIAPADGMSTYRHVLMPVSA